MIKKKSVSVDAILLACAMAIVLAVILWREPGVSTEAARSGPLLTGATSVSAVISDVDLRGNESRTPASN